MIISTVLPRLDVAPSCAKELFDQGSLGRSFVLRASVGPTIQAVTQSHLFGAILERFIFMRPN